MKLRLAEEAYLLERMAALDPEGTTALHGGQIVRDQIFTPAGLLISEQYAAIEAQPASGAWWAKVIPVAESTAPPGEYL